MMKNFEVKLTQEMVGVYIGSFTIEAKTQKEADKLVGNMSKEELDANADWEHGDSYDGLVETTEIESIDLLY